MYLRRWGSLRYFVNYISCYSETFWILFNKVAEIMGDDVELLRKTLSE